MGPMGIPIHPSPFTHFQVSGDHLDRHLHAPERSGDLDARDATTDGGDRLPGNRNTLGERRLPPVCRGAPHALEQLGGVAAGVHPQIRLLASADNIPQREAMAWLRVRLLAIVVLSLFATVCLIGWLLLRRRRPGEVTA